MYYSTSDVPDVLEYIQCQFCTMAHICIVCTMYTLDVLNTKHNHTTVTLLVVGFSTRCLILDHPEGTASFCSNSCTFLRDVGVALKPIPLPHRPKSPISYAL